VEAVYYVSPSNLEAEDEINSSAVYFKWIVACGLTYDPEGQNTQFQSQNLKKKKKSLAATYIWSVRKKPK
jgi:hypothetical protein